MVEMTRIEEEDVKKDEISLEKVCYYIPSYFELFPKRPLEYSKN